MFVSWCWSFFRHFVITPLLHTIFDVWEGLGKHEIQEMCLSNYSLMAVVAETQQAVARPGCYWSASVSPGQRLVCWRHVTGARKDGRLETIDSKLGESKLWELTVGHNYKHHFSPALTKSGTDNIAHLTDNYHGVLVMVDQ